ncbi:hypothetical protein, partial [Gluconobacter frateurii]
KYIKSKIQIEKTIEEYRKELDKFYYIRDGAIEQKEKIRKIQFLLLAPIVILLLYMIFIFINQILLDKTYTYNGYNVLSTLSIPIAFFSIVIYSNIYLKYGTIFLDDYYSVSMAIRSNKFDLLDNESLKLNNDVNISDIINNSEKSKLGEDTYPRNEKEEFFGTVENDPEFKKEYLYKALSQDKILGYDDIFLNSRNRILTEIDRLSNSGNFNLAIGVATTFLSVLALGVVVFIQNAPEHINHIQYISTIIMRLSIAVFIEVFAYFFLKLYKKNLEEIRFFQNEISNLDYKWAALSVSLENDDLTKISVENLISTERNYLLKPGETTIELEREKMEKNEILEIVRDVTNIIKIREDSGTKKKK